MLRPTLMTRADLDSTVTACAHILGCDERYGTINPTVRRHLETLLDEAAKEQTARRTSTASAVQRRTAEGLSEVD